MKVTTRDISDPFKNHPISNVLVSFVETTQNIEKSPAKMEALSYRASVKSCFGSIGKKLGSDFRVRTLRIRVCLQV